MSETISHPKAEVLWQPSAEGVAASNLTRYLGWLAQTRSRRFADYAALWSWSTEEPGEFWSSIAEFYGVPFHTPASEALSSRALPGARWFPGATLCLYEGADLTVPAQVADLVARVSERLGAIDVLVNNAGMQFVSPLESFPQEKWDAILALNLSAAFHTTKAVLPGMRQRRWGRIVNISSAHGMVASPFKAAYVASKHGLIGLTKVTALETARDGITCNALCPGFIHTPIVEGQIEEQARATGIARERVVEEIILAKHATKAFVRAEQVAAFVVMLCTEAGASTTGAAIPIDGGWTAA